MLEREVVDVVRDRAGDDVKALCEQGEIDRRIAADEFGAVDPRLSRRGGLRHDHGDGALDAGKVEADAGVAPREPRTAAGDESTFTREIAVVILDAVEGGPGEPLAGEIGAGAAGRLGALL